MIFKVGLAPKMLVYYLAPSPPQEKEEKNHYHWWREEGWGSNHLSSTKIFKTLLLNLAWIVLLPLDPQNMFWFFKFMQHQIFLVWNKLYTILRLKCDKFTPYKTNFYTSSEHVDFGDMLIVYRVHCAHISVSEALKFWKNASILQWRVLTAQV